MARLASKSNVVFIFTSKILSRSDRRPKYNRKLPLKGYSIVLAGRLSKTSATLKQEIQDLGGTVLSVVDETIDLIISTQGYLFYSYFILLHSSFFFNKKYSIDEVQKNNKKIQDAQLFKIHVVPIQFLDDIQNERPWIVMEKLKLSTWGIVPHIRKQHLTKCKSNISTNLCIHIDCSTTKENCTRKNCNDIKGWYCN